MVFFFFFSFSSSWKAAMATVSRPLLLYLGRFSEMASANRDERFPFYYSFLQVSVFYRRSIIPSAFWSTLSERKKSSPDESDLFLSSTSLLISSFVYGATATERRTWGFIYFWFLCTFFFFYVGVNHFNTRHYHSLVTWLLPRHLFSRPVDLDRLPLLGSRRSCLLTAVSTVGYSAHASWEPGNLRKTNPIGSGVHHVKRPVADFFFFFDIQFFVLLSGWSALHLPWLFLSFSYLPVMHVFWQLVKLQCSTTEGLELSTGSFLQVCLCLFHIWCSLFCSLSCCSIYSLCLCLFIVLHSVFYLVEGHKKPHSFEPGVPFDCFWFFV